MKKQRITTVLIGIVFMCISSATQAHSVELDFYSLFEHHKSVMLLIDAQTGEIDHANQAAADFYGYTIEELESMNTWEITTLTPENMRGAMRLAVAEVKNNFIFEHRLASGEIRTVEVYSCPHVHGDKTLLFSTIHDITEQVELAEKNKKMTGGFMLVLSVAAVCLALLSWLLFRNYRKLQDHYCEISNFNALRKSFMDAHQSIIYLKALALHKESSNKSSLKISKISKKITDK